MRAEVEPGKTFSAGKPSRFFTGGYSSADWYQGQGRRSFDLSPGGQRFIVVKDQRDADSRRPSSMNVILSWGEDLKARERAGSNR